MNRKSKYKIGDYVTIKTEEECKKLSYGYSILNLKSWRNMYGKCLKIVTVEYNEKMHIHVYDLEDLDGQLRSTANWAEDELYSLKDKLKML